MSTCFWLHLEFLICPPWHYVAFNRPGLYIFCRRYNDGSVAPLYIGQAEDVSSRLGRSHEKWQEAHDWGFNELHVKVFKSTKAFRCEMEDRLLSQYPTPLNQTVPTGTLADAAPSRNTLRDIYYGVSGTRLREVYATEPLGNELLGSLSDAPMRPTGLLGSLSDVPTPPRSGFGKRGLF